MLNCSNYFLLVSLAIISWIFLCLSNSKPAHMKYGKEKREAHETVGGLSYWPENVFYSLISVNSSVMIYIACTLLGVFIIANIIKRKMGALCWSKSVSTVEISSGSMKYQLAQLKSENRSLLASIKQFKLEKDFLIQHVKFNKNVIQKLSSDLRTAREQLDLLKCRYCISSDKSILRVQKKKSIEQNSTSSAGIIENYFGKESDVQCSNKYNTLTLTVSNHNIINEILMEAFNGINVGAKEIKDHVGTRNLSIIDKKTDYYNAKQKSIETLKKDLFAGFKENNINIVSTCQLEMLKGLY